MAAGRGPAVALALAALVVATNLLSVRHYLRDFRKEGWREAAAFVAQAAQQGDLLLFNAPWVQIAFDYYFQGAGPGLEERGAPVDLFERGLEPRMASDDLPRLRALLAGRPRAWLIYSHNWYTDPQGLVPGVLAEEMRPTSVRNFTGLQVRLYEER